MLDAHALVARKSLGWLALGVLLLGSFGCSYNQHTNMGNTEKWVNSDVNMIPKSAGMVLVPVFDSIVSPFTAAGDQIFRDNQYEHEHRYLSYAGSRTIARSDMPLGYQWAASVFSIVIETAWLPVTVLVDLFTVLWTGDDGTQEKKDA